MNTLYLIVVKYSVAKYCFNKAFLFVSSVSEPKSQGNTIHYFD